MNKTTEDEILLQLESDRPMTILELASALNLTKADIRYHIKKLRNDGTIEIVKPKSGMRGRPAVRYKLTNQYYPNNYENLAMAFLYTKTFSKEELVLTAEFFTKNIIEDISCSPIIKLNKLVIELNKQNFAARWETQIYGPVMFFNNCPYRKIIKDHPILCELDRNIIEKYMGKKVTTLQTIGQSNSHYCKFQIDS